MIKRLLSLLPALLLLYSLCAGFVSASAEDGEAEKVYVSRQVELLVRQTVEPGFYSGKKLGTETFYEYDKYGNPVSETSGFLYYNPFENTTFTADSENVKCSYDDAGRLRRVEIESSERTALIYEYDENEQLRHYEEHVDKMWLPETKIEEIDEYGYLTDYYYNWESVGSAEEHFRYDPDSGNMLSLRISINGGPEQTMTPVYDENGGEIATKHVASDGGEVTVFYHYDDEGRLTLIEYDAAEPHLNEYLFVSDTAWGKIRSNEYKAGDNHITIALNYNELGLVSDAEWRSNGDFLCWTQYQFIRQSERQGRGECSGLYLSVGAQGQIPDKVREYRGRLCSHPDV